MKKIALILALLVLVPSAAFAVDEAARRAEWDRRNAKYPNAPYYLPPGPVDMYDNKAGSGNSIGTIPTGIKFLILEGKDDWFPKIYCPAMDLEGWFNRMQLCAYKGNNVVLDNNEISKLEQELFDKSWDGSAPPTPPADPVATTPPADPVVAPPATDPEKPATPTSKTPYEPPAWTRADPESTEYKQGLRAEKERREKKYEGFPEYRFPWLDLKIYKDETMKEEVAAIPAGVRCLIITDAAAWNVKLYCPSMDVEGWFDRMILCAFKGSNLTIDLNEAYKLEEKCFMESLGKEPSPDPIGPVVKPGSAAPPATATKPPATTPAKPTATKPTSTGSKDPSKPGGTVNLTSGLPTAPPALPPTVAEPPKPVEPEEKPIATATNVSGLKVWARVDKTPNAASPMQVPPAATVNVLRNEGDWCYIEYGGKKGWVRAFYIGLGK